MILVTHDRYFLDQVTKWTLELDRGKGLPYEGNYSALAGAEDQARSCRSSRESEARQRAIDPRTGLGALRRQGARRPSPRPAWPPTTRWSATQEQRAGPDLRRIQIPPGPRLGNVVLEVDGLEKDYGDKVLFKGLTFKLPPNGIVGVIGPNGAGKSTLFKLITGQEKPDAGTIKRRRDGEAGLRRPEPRHARSRTRTSGRRSPAASTCMMVGKREINTPRLCRLVQLQGRRPAEEGRPAVGR